MCRGGAGFKNRYTADRHLTVNDFLKFLSGVDLNRLKILNLAGNSEPLINPDILQIIAICRELKIIIEIITNGMLLTAQVSKELLGCASEIHVSFGGATKKVFESIRQGADFYQICENIRFLNRLKIRKNQNFPRIWINPVLMKRNIHELTGMVELAKQLNCCGVACSHLIVKSPELIEESLYFYQEECNKAFRDAQKVARKNHITLILPPYFDKSAQSEKNRVETKDAWRHCRFLWNHAIIGIESLMPCGDIGTEIDFDGNVFNNRFMDIWNNSWYANARYRLLTGNPPDICKKCSDPSIKDANYIGSYFSDALLPEALSFDGIATSALHSTN